MPTNLNALIRFRTIDECLKNTYREWTIDDLVEACNSALGESRGASVSVSERTIREDIRVMRSDILGFNAPIVVNDGKYSYKRPYSLFAVAVDPDQTDLLVRIYRFLFEIRETARIGVIGDLLMELEEVLPNKLVNEIQEEEYTPGPDHPAPTIPIQAESEPEEADLEKLQDRKLQPPLRRSADKYPSKPNFGLIRDLWQILFNKLD